MSYVLMSNIRAAPIGVRSSGSTPPPNAMPAFVWEVLVRFWLFLRLVALDQIESWVDRCGRLKVDACPECTAHLHVCLRLLCVCVCVFLTALSLCTETSPRYLVLRRAR